jgi:DNA-binding transcriptional MerR regulator
MANGTFSGTLLSIGDVSARTGIAQHVLRYWEGRLPQLRPVKRAGGRRYYRPEDVGLIVEVKRLVDEEGFTLDGAARAVHREAPTVSSTPLPAYSGGTGTAIESDLVTKLEAVRDRLAKALANAS